MPKNPAPSGLSAMLGRAQAKPTTGEGVDPAELAAAKAAAAKADAERGEALRQRDAAQKVIEQLKADGHVAQGTELVPVDDLVHPPWNCWEATPESTTTLADDIRERGLIEPLIVDVDNVVVAGDNRLRALRLLQADQASWFAMHYAKGIPVHRLDLRYADAPFEAGLKQMAANFNRRKPPTPAQLRPHLLALLEEMPRDHYHFGRGNPGAKEPVVPLLMKAFGVSRRTITRALAEDDDTAAEIESGTAGGKTKKPTRLVHFKRVLKQTTDLLDQVRELPTDARNPDVDDWIRTTAKLQKQLDKLISSERDGRA